MDSSTSVSETIFTVFGQLPSESDLIENLMYIFVIFWKVLARYLGDL